MRLRTFTAADMPSAMQMVRDELGEDAIILASEKHNGKSIRVTAAIDMRDETASPAPQTNGHRQPLPRSEPRADNLRFDLQNVLRFHNVPELYIAKMLQRTTDADLSAAAALHRVGGSHDEQNLYRLALEKLLGRCFAFDPLPLDSPSMRLMLVGTPGIGKTLTIAKLAARLTMDGQKLAVITTDNKRAGGIEQLQAFTNILNINLRPVSTRQELTKELNALPSGMRVLVDTAGCNHYSDSELKELKSLATLEDLDPALVMPAGGDSAEAIDMAEAFAAYMPLKRLLVTRADTARRFGGILAVAAAQNLSFCHVSSSPSIVDTLQPVNAALLAQLLLRYQLQPS